MVTCLMFVDEKVDIVETYTFIKAHLPVGSVIPVSFGESEGSIKALILGHVIKNIRKSPKKHLFSDICLPIFLHGREKYMCSLHESDGQVLGVSTLANVFEAKTWQTSDYIVEEGSILP